MIFTPPPASPAGVLFCPAGVAALAGLFLFVMHHERLVQETSSILSFAQRPAQLMVRSTKVIS